MLNEDNVNTQLKSCPGLHVVYGSRTRRGLSHPNEDRHAVAIWADWNSEAYLKEADDASDFPQPETVVPTCMGSARKDTTLSGNGGTGALRDPHYALSLQLGTKDTVTSRADPSAQASFLWTVCDGHDGPEAADFVCKSVGETFSKTWHRSGNYKMPHNYLKDKTLAPGEDLQTFAKGYALSNTLARTYEILDQQFKQLVCPEDGQASTLLGSAADPKSVAGSTAGSCVTSIFLMGNLLCCASLGDCKSAILTLEEADNSSPEALRSDTVMSNSTGHAMAQQQFQVTWFSKEHRSNAPKERARIRARGGWFRHGRVGGVLEPTRTIGDFDVKASQPPGVLIATPEVRTFNVTKPAMVLIASDGVWDVMDASQLLRTLKKRRRLWRGVLSWLGAPVPERRPLMNFGFRKRAKSKEGLSGILQLPTGGDLVAMAEALVTRAHDLGSDDDCTCVCIYLRPAQPARIPETPAANLGDASGAAPLLPSSTAAVAKRDSDAENNSKRESEVEEGESDEDEEEEDDELEDVEPAGQNDGDLSADSSYEYEKWRKPEEGDGIDEDVVDNDQNPDKETDEWKLATNVFPVSEADKNVDEEAPEIVEKARRRREERRAARERRRKSLEGQTWFDS